MNKIVVYGLGKDYESQKAFLKNTYDIVGYSDKCNKNIEKYIYPKDICSMKFDFVYITSSKYLEEIKEELFHLGIKKEKIKSLYDILGDFKNWEIKKEWIIGKLNLIPEGKTILDAGAGEQQYKPYCRHLKYISQDFGEYDSNSGEGGLPSPKWDTSECDIICDIIDIPLENESVDIVLCSEVFEHLKNPILALKEFSRLLKKGGSLLLTAPFCCLTHMAPYFYYNGFSEYWYKEYLGEYGFEIKEITRNGNFFKYLCQELFRVASMTEQYCDKRLTTEEMRTIMKSIKILSKISNFDKGSAETLCFGYMIEAIKR